MRNRRKRSSIGFRRARSANQQIIKEEQVEVVLADPSTQLEVDKESEIAWSTLTENMNENQMAFCEYYIESRDAKSSYMNAYPEAKSTSATSSGYRLLKQEKIYNYINALLNEYGPKIRITNDELIAEVEKMAMNPDLNSGQKLAAAKMLGQARGMFADKMEVTTKEFIIDFINDDEEY